MGSANGRTVSLADDGPLSIGIDLGTSSLKAVAVTVDGAVVARASHGYPTSREAPGGAEQRPADWINACDRALDDLGRTTDPTRWGAIGLTAMLPTLVSLDDQLREVGPAITWEDGRAEPDAERMLDHLGADAVYRSTGQRLDGRYLLPMHLRRSRERPDATRILGAKDHLLHILTGELATDPSTAAGYGCFDLRTGAWNDRIVATAGLPRLPDVVPSSTAFALRAEHAERWGCAPGLPVVVGAADSVMGAYGMGITGPGRIGMIAGTSTVVIGWSHEVRLDPHARYLVTPMVAEGYGLELDLMSTGSAVAWLAGLLGLDGGPDELVALAASVDLEVAPIVLPYFGPGEQGALWNPALTGLVEGLTLQTSQAGLSRGLLAGIVLEATRCVDVLREGRTGTDDVILLTGSSGASELFRQDLADATGLRVRSDPAEFDHSAVGAARFAGYAALGWGAEPDAPAREERRPDPARTTLWRERFSRHERARLALGRQAG